VCSERLIPVTRVFCVTANHELHSLVILQLLILKDLRGCGDRTLVREFVTISTWQNGMFGGSRNCLPSPHPASASCAQVVFVAAL
jgi:hypothetical protein